MRKLCTAFVALMAGGMITIGGNALSAQNLVKKYQRPKKMMIQKRAAEKVERQALSEDSYGWSGTDWVLSAKSKMKYDGNKLMEKVSDVYQDGEIIFSNKDVFKYNENDKEIECVQYSSNDQGGTWEISAKKVKDYDSVRKEAMILDETYFWDAGANEWYLNEENEDGFFVELERDAEGRVVKSTRWLNSMKPIALVSQQFTYDDKRNGAVGMTWEALDENYELIPAYYYEDMKWYQTDNQYVNLIPSIYYAFDADAKNNISSYKIYKADMTGAKGDLEAAFKTTYDDKGRMSYVEISFADGTLYQCQYIYDKDENGSFEYRDVISSDMNGNGTIDPEECIMGLTITTCNKYGDIIKEEMYEVDSEMNQTLNEGYLYEMIYNEEDLLVERILSYYTTLVEGGSWEKMNKTVFYDYNDGTTTGIAAADKGRADVSLINNTLYFNNARGAHYTVSDLSGKTYAHGVAESDKVRLNNLPEGMYIVKISGKNCNNSVKLIKK